MYSKRGTALYIRGFHTLYMIEVHGQLDNYRALYVYLSKNFPLHHPAVTVRYAEGGTLVRYRPIHAFIK